MLRRKPTALTITPEDLIAFEEERLQKAAEAEKTRKASEQEEEEQERVQAGAASFAMTSKKYDPNDELKPLPGDKARIVRSRDERIGIGRRG
jgi:Anaphase-promoting complex APC subunit CDC26